MSCTCVHSLPLQGPKTRSSPARLACLPQVPRSRRCLARLGRRRSIVPLAYFTVRGPGPKASKTSYICKDCGYIYEGKDSFENLPNSYACPVCSSPKRRFKVYDNPVERNANATANRQARKTKLQSGSGWKVLAAPDSNALGGVGARLAGRPDLTQLIIAGCAAAVVLVGLYAALNALY